MWTSELPPFVPFLIAALLALLTRGRLRAAIMLAAPALGGLHLWLDVMPGTTLSMQVLEFELVLLRTDRLSLLFGYLFHIAAFISVIFALHVRDTTQHVAGLVYAGSALGAVFAGDLITLFIFWELLALSSVFLIWARRNARASRAGIRYLLFQVSFGPAAAGRRAPALPADRFAGLRLHRPGGHQRLADLSRLRHQVRLPAAAQLADRRLPGSHTHRHGVPVRLHHQGGGLCTGARFSGHRACWCISAS